MSSKVKLVKRLSKQSLWRLGRPCNMCGEPVGLPYIVVSASGGRKVSKWYHVGHYPRDSRPR